jgi:low temperature requirement protein LtrA
VGLVRYGWLTNSIDPDQNLNRVCMFAAMGGMLVVSLSIPDAFGDGGDARRLAPPFQRI